MYIYHISAILIYALTFVGYDTLKCISMSDQKCKVRPAIMNVNSNEPVLYLYSVLVSSSIRTFRSFYINYTYTKRPPPPVFCQSLKSRKVFSIFTMWR